MIYVVYSFYEVDQVDCLKIGMVTTDRTKAEAFAASPESQPVHGRYDWEIAEVEDGEWNPDIG